MSRSFIISTLIAVLIFSGSVAAGAGLVYMNPDIGEAFMELAHEALNIEEMMGSPPSTLALNLFINNLQACIILFLGGVTFGLLTTFVLIANGVIVGAVAQIAMKLQGITFVIAALAPHGITELPALFISGALGFMLAREMRRELEGEGDAASEAGKYATIFVQVVVPLLLIAAITEAFITPAIILMVV